MGGDVHGQQRAQLVLKEFCLFENTSYLGRVMEYAKVLGDNSAAGTSPWAYDLPSMPNVSCKRLEGCIMDHWQPAIGSRQ